MALTKITGQVVNTSTDLTVGVLTATTVSVGGTLTYEDVTNVDSVGLITARNGIQVTDKGVQVGTGATVDSAAANTLTFLTGGSERLRIDSSGELVSNNGTLRRNVSDSSFTVSGDSASNTGANINLFGASHGSLASVFRVRTGSTERLRITSDGDVGIGEDSPADRLAVQETNASGDVAVRIKNDTTTDGSAATPTTASLYLTTSTGDFNTFYMQARRTDNNTHFGYSDPRGDNHTPNLVIASGGDIGISETTPDSKVDIVHSTSTNSSTENLIHLRTDPGAGYVSRGLFVKIGRDGSYDNSAVHYDIVGSSGNSGTHIFEVQGSEKLRIDSSGRLLLGTTTEGHATADNFTIADSGHCGITLRSGDDDVGTIFFSDGTSGDAEYEGYVQYDHTGNFMKFATNHAETLRIDSSGLITQGGKTASNHGSPNLLLWGADPTLHISATGSSNNSSFSGIKFAVAGGSTGDYSKAGIFVQRQDSYNDLDMIFAFRSTNDSAGVAISDEKVRINSDGNVSITQNPTTNASKLFIRANQGTNAGKWADSCIALYNTTGASEYSQMGFGYTLGTWAPSYMGYINTSTSSFGMGDLVFGTRNVVTDSQPTERLRITSDGIVRSSSAGIDGSSLTLDLGSSQLVAGFQAKETSGAAQALSGYWFNHGGLNAGMASTRQVTNQWGTDLRFYTHPFATSNQHYVYERFRIDPDGRIFIRDLLGNASSGSAVKYSNSDDELRYDTSSKLLKTNITECPYGIETVKKLKPSRYTPQEYDKEGNINVTDEVLIGFIAEEMVEEVPEVVQMYAKSTLTRNDEDTEIVPAAISYDKLTAVLTKALQEAIAKIETLETQNADLLSRVTALEG